jgi:hypothetical protein
MKYVLYMTTFMPNGVNFTRTYVSNDMVQLIIMAKACAWDRSRIETRRTI